MSDEPRSKAIARASNSQDARPQPSEAQRNARLQALRQAIAQSDRKDVETRQALYLALAQAIEQALQGTTRAEQREQLEFEQANALFHGQAFHRAGLRFESLGELELAARCYRNAGSIEALEAIHERQEKAEANAKSRALFEQKLDEAFAAGRRNLVLEQCEALLADPKLQSEHPELMTRLHTRARDIRGRTPSPTHTKLRLQQPGSEHPALTLHLVWGTRLCAGRSPSAALTLHDPSLSREHLAIEIEDAQVRIEDLGSRTGTFLDGDALVPHQAIPLFPGETHRVGLGMHSELELYVTEPGPVLWARLPQASAHWTLLSPETFSFLPPAGMDLDLALPNLPDLSLVRDPRHGALELIHDKAKVELSLGRHRINAPEALQLLTQDRLELRVNEQSWVLEVLA